MTRMPRRTAVAKVGAALLRDPRSFLRSRPRFLGRSAGILPGSDPLDGRVRFGERRAPPPPVPLPASRGEGTQGRRLGEGTQGRRLGEGTEGRRLGEGN